MKNVQSPTIRKLLDLWHCYRPTGCDCDWHKAMAELVELEMIVYELDKFLERIELNG